MVLNVEAAGLIEEINAAIKLRDSHLSAMDDQLEKYHGPYYQREATDTADYAPENTYYEYVSLMVPRLVFDNPRVRCTSRRPGAQAEVAEALKHGLNRWVRDVNLRRLLVEMATDMLFNFGVCLVREDDRQDVVLPEMDPQMAATPKWPRVERVSQRRFFVDADASRWEDARLMGHEWKRDREDLLKMAKDNPEGGWNVDAIEGMAEDNDRSEWEEKNKPGVPFRKEVYVYELWLPEKDLKDSPGAEAGFHGTIYTLAANASLSSTTKDGKPVKGEFIREPRPFYGPRTGPYAIFGVYKVPDLVYPLAPLTAVEGQIRELNTHVSSASNSMMKHKRIVGVNDPRTAQLVKDVQHDYVAVVPFEDGRALVQEFELGGQTEQQANWIAVSRQRADRVLGMDEALRGSVTGMGTATEHSIASESAATRMAYIRQSFTDSVVDMLRAVAFYMYHDDEVVFPLGEEAMLELGLMPGEEPWFQGGGHGDSGYSFDDLELEIEPYSMERSSEGLAQKRALEAHQILLGSLQSMQMFPDYPWKDHFAKIGNAMNLPDLAELVTDELLGRLSEDLQRMQESEAMAMQQSSQPRLGKDVGRAGVGAPNRGKLSQSAPKLGQMMGQMLQGIQQPGGAG